MNILLLFVGVIIVLIMFFLFLPKIMGVFKPWIRYVNKSYKYCRKGEYLKSIEFAKKALELNPRSSEAWRLIGNNYEFIGDDMELTGDNYNAEKYHNKATEAWDKAKQINPNVSIPGYHR